MATSLARDYQAGRLPGAGQALIDGFLARYGLRGLAEIDLGRPRWNEQPAHVLDVLTSYIQIERPEQAPDVVFARGAKKRPCEPGSASWPPSARPARLDPGAPGALPDRADARADGCA